MIRDAGLRPLVNYLSQPSCTLIELSLMGNKINNEGIHILAEFIKPNNTLKMLDISKNAYGDNAFNNFAQEMGQHATLTFLDISKSKELNDEGSLITLAKQLAHNTYLQTLDLSGVRVRKPYLKLYMEPSLRKNITLKYVVGKLTPDIIDEQLNINIQI
jgi:Ran GTPase-activating protein (RanGAP) involved in mRNA processing and transport